MDWNQALVAPATGSTDPTSSVAGQILLSARQPRDRARPGSQVRLADADHHAHAASARPAPTATTTRPGSRFLLIDNQGNIREALRPFFPTPPGVAPTFANARRAEMVVRLDGNQTTQQEGTATVAVDRGRARRALRRVHHLHHRGAGPAQA